MKITQCNHSWQVVATEGKVEEIFERMALRKAWHMFRWVDGVRQAPNGFISLLRSGLLAKWFVNYDSAPCVFHVLERIICITLYVVFWLTHGNWNRLVSIWEYFRWCLLFTGGSQISSYNIRIPNLLLLLRYFWRFRCVRRKREGQYSARNSIRYCVISLDGPFWQIRRIFLLFTSRCSIRCSVWVEGGNNKSRTQRQRACPSVTILSILCSSLKRVNEWRSKIIRAKEFVSNYLLCVSLLKFSIVNEDRCKHKNNMQYW